LRDGRDQLLVDGLGVHKAAGGKSLSGVVQGFGKCRQDDRLGLVCGG
jgi:hypothetical protein